MRVGPHPLHAEKPVPARLQSREAVAGGNKPYSCTLVIIEIVQRSIIYRTDTSVGSAHRIIVYIGPLQFVVYRCQFQIGGEAGARQVPVYRQIIVGSRTSANI